MRVKVQAKVEVNRPPVEVFAWLTDFGEWPRWGGQLVSMELLTPGPPQVGSWLKQVTRRGRIIISTDVEITDLVENRYLAIKSRDLAGRFTLTPAGDATRIRSAVDVDAQGIWAILYRLLLKQFLLSDLRNLKRLVERD